MKLPTLLPILALALLAAPLLHAVEQGEVDRDKMLKQLDDIATKHQAAQEGSMSSVLSEVNAAATNPAAGLSLYEKAVLQTQYEGKKNGQVDFLAWKKRIEPLIHDANFIDALALRYRYLALTLQVIEGTDRAKLADPLAAYVRDVWAFPADYADTSLKQPSNGDRPPDLIHDLFQGGLAEGPVEKYYQLDRQIMALKNWALTPGDTVAILNQDLFPTLRKDKSPVLIALWDERITVETNLANGKNALTDQRERFESDGLPTLQWGRAKDLMVLGRTDEGLREMLNIIQSYPLHADNPKWIAQLRDFLKGGNGEVEAPAAPK